MKQMITATGLAALFAVGLAAQSTTGTAGSTPQDPQTTTASGTQARGGPRTITGCLRAGDTEGTYMLTNVEGLGGGRMAAGGETTTGGAPTTTGAAAPTAGAAATTGASQARAMAGSIMLSADSSVDLKAHVGHKIEVTGTLAGGGRRGVDMAGATTTGGGTTTGTAAGTTTGAGQTAGTTGAQAGGRGMRSMTVTSVKMISDSCS